MRRTVGVIEWFFAAQRRLEPIRIGGTLGMIGAGLLDGLGLGLFDEAGRREALGERVAFLFRCVDGFGQAGTFGGKIDHTFE